MIQKLVLVFSLLFYSLCLSQTYYINVNLHDGTTVQYNIADIQKIDFGGITSNIEHAEKIGHVIKSFKLLQNYPNPFNPSTTIEYEIPKTSDISIAVYDLNGQLIKTLVKKSQQKGKYKVKWDGANNYNQKVSSGFYIYTIKSNNTVSSKKMILIK